jgi:ribosomal protein L21
VLKLLGVNRFLAQVVIRGRFHDKNTGDCIVRGRGRRRRGGEDPSNIFTGGSKTSKSKATRPPAPKPTPKQAKPASQRKPTAAEMKKRFEQTQASAAPAVPAAYLTKQIKPQAAPSVFKKDKEETLEQKSAALVEKREALDKPSEIDVPEIPIEEIKEVAEVPLVEAENLPETPEAPLSSDEKSIEEVVETPQSEDNAETELPEEVNAIEVQLEVMESEATVSLEQVVIAPEGETIIANPHLEGAAKKSIEAVAKKVGSFKPKRRRRPDQKGGGRQPKSKKLSRRKYLEYKYEVKDILDNEAVEEEHRSNIIGQIWAKGERIGIDAAIEFIEEKEAELILPANIAAKLKTLVYSYTTRR